MGGVVMVLTFGAATRLVKTGAVDVWSLRRPSRKCDRCGYAVKPARKENVKKGILARPARCTGCKQLTEGVEQFPQPALNVIHLVRTHHERETIVRAQATSTRPGVLQELTYPEALSAGFKTRDDLWDHFRLKYATGPLVDRPVDCWVTSYRAVEDHPEYFMLAQPVPGHSGDYTSSSVRTIDQEAEGLDSLGHDERLFARWTERAEAQRKAARRLEWRGGREAA